MRPKSDGDEVIAPLTATDLAITKEAWIVITNDGRISRTPTMRIPRLAGRNPPQLVIGSSGRDTLYLFDERGSAAAIPLHVIPEVDRPESGIPLKSVSPFSPNVKLAVGIAAPQTGSRKNGEAHFLLLCTRLGMMKKTALDSFPGPSAKTFVAMKIARGDSLGWACLTDGEDELLLISRQGMAIRFSESHIRPMGLATAGVMGMKLEDKDDQIVWMSKVSPRVDVLLVSQDGQTKRTGISQFPLQGRYGKGVLAWKSGEGAVLVGSAVGNAELRATVIFTKSAPKSLRVGDAVRRNRTSAGTQAFELDGGDLVKQLRPVQPRVATVKKSARSGSRPTSRTKSSGRKAPSSSTRRQPKSRGSTTTKRRSTKAKPASSKGGRTSSKGTTRASSTRTKSSPSKSTSGGTKKTTRKS